MYGPQISGRTFVLRPPREAEAELITRWFEDQEVTARLKFRTVPSLEMEREFLRSMAVNPSAIFWGIEHEQRLVGTTGIVQIDWQDRRGKTGTLIGDKRAWGKGIAGEMMRLRADYAFKELGLNKLESSYIEDNVASGRAQAGAGYTVVGRLRQHVWREGRWLDLVVTELLREDWAKGL